MELAEPEEQNMWQDELDPCELCPHRVWEQQLW